MPRPLVINDTDVGHVLDSIDVAHFVEMRNTYASTLSRLTRAEQEIRALASENVELFRQLQANIQGGGQSLTVSVPPGGNFDSSIRPGDIVNVSGGGPVYVAAPTARAVPVVNGGTGTTTTIASPASPASTRLAASVPAPSVGPSAPTPGGEPAAGGVTVDQVRAAIQLYGRDHGAENARRVLTRLGFANVNAIPADHRQNVLNAIQNEMNVPVAQIAETQRA